MRKSRLKIIFVLSAAALLLSFAACSDFKINNPLLQSENYETVEINRDIVLVNTYSNYAWGWEYYGYYVDKEGFRHDFDFSEDESICFDDVSDMEKVLDLLESGYAGSGERLLSESKVKNFYGNLLKVEGFAFDEGESFGCDMGESTLYGVINDESGERVIIPIIQYGDWTGKNTDEYAVKAAKAVGINSEDSIYQGLYGLK